MENKASLCYILNQEHLESENPSESDCMQMQKCNSNVSTRFKSSVNPSRTAAYGTSRFPDTCKHCGKKFLSVQNLKKHVKVMHDFKRKYCCCICKTTFSRIDKLRNHVQIVRLLLFHLAFVPCID